MTLVCFYPFPVDVLFAQSWIDTFNEPLKPVALCILTLYIHIYFLSAARCTDSIILCTSPWACT